MVALAYVRRTDIHRPVEEVFDYCSDLRNELEWNPDARSVALLTGDPVGLGSRYRAEWAGAPPTTVEVVRYERPNRWETRSRAMGMDVSAQGGTVPVAAGTRYTVRLEIRPTGLAHLIAPLALVAMRRREERNMRLIREALEGRASA